MATIPHLASHLRFAIARTARRMRQEAGTGLSPTLTAALATIDRHGPLTPSELATRECVQRPTATKLIAKLEAEGLVDRTVDIWDKRSSLIEITSAGHVLLEDARTRKDEFLAERLRKLSAEERAVLDRAAEILERMLEEDRRR